jgi:hypothetical protein
MLTLARPIRLGRLPLGGLARPRSAVVIVAVLGYLVPAGIGALKGKPLAYGHDEFSRLLGADTFAHGRLANPPAPFPEHLLSPHILLRPTYASKYFPAEALVFAVGQRLLGDPAHGVWLSCAIAAMALYWMLFRLVGPRPALLGTTLMILTMGSRTYWAQGYWSAMLPFAGGALVMSALGSPRRGGAVTNAGLVGLGAAALSLSRPFEGLLLTVSVLPAALLLGERPLRARLKPTVCLAFSLPIVTAVGFQLVLDHAVTGSAWRTPYQEHQRRYAPVPNFGPSRPAASLPAPTEPLNPRVAAFEVGYTQQLFEHSTLRWRVEKTLDAVRFLPNRLTGESPYTGVPLLLVFGSAPWLIHRRRLRLLLSIGALVLVGRLFTWNHGRPDYLALLAPIFYLALVDGARILGTLRVSHRRAGRRFRPRWLVLATGIGWLAALPTAGSYVMHSRMSTGIFPYDRERMIELLKRRPGRDLLLVSYADDYPIQVEWVYDAARPDQQQVLLVHDLGPLANAPLLEHYCDRLVWRARVSQTSSLELLRLPCGAARAAPRPQR